MGMEQLELILNRREIRPTSNRMLILKTMLQSHQALSLMDMESMLETVDKSSIFRTINLFLAHQLIHRIDDGSGSIKYAVCSDTCDCKVDELHAHFFCEVCTKTFCLDDIHIPVVKTPQGYILKSINYVLKGVCSECNKDAH